MNGAQIFAEWLCSQAGNKLFYFPGFQIDALLQAVSRNDAIHCTQTIGESSAAYAAIGYALASGNLAVSLGIGAPGLTEAMTPLLVAHKERAPVLFITGASPQKLNGYLPFQDTSAGELRDTKISSPFVKATFSPYSPEALKQVLGKASRIALKEPQGPVHVSIPFDVQSAEIKGAVSESEEMDEPVEMNSHDDVLQRVAESLASKPRILAYLGTYDPTGRCRAFLETCHIPVITTLGAKSALEESHPLALGNAGFAGMPRANQALLSPDVDTLLLLDVPLSERNSLAWNPDIMTNRSIIALGSKVFPGVANSKGFLSCEGPASLSLSRLRNLAPEAWHKLISSNSEREDWILSSLAEFPKMASITSSGESGSVDPSEIVEQLNQSLPDSIFIPDAGVARVVSAMYRISGYRKFISAATDGPMGFSLAAALGAVQLNPNPGVVSLIGDGSLLLHGHDLATVVKYRFPIVIVLFNNQGMSTVARRFRDLPSSKMIEQAPVAWEKYASAFDCPYIRVTDSDQLRQALEQALVNIRTQHGPLFIDVICPRYWNSHDLSLQSGYYKAP